MLLSARHSPIPPPRTPHRPGPIGALSICRLRKSRSTSRTLLVYGPSREDRKPLAFAWYSTGSSHGPRGSEISAFLTRKYGAKLPGQITGPEAFPGRITAAVPQPQNRTMTSPTLVMAGRVRLRGRCRGRCVGWCRDCLARPATWPRTLGHTNSSRTRQLHRQHEPRSQRF